MIVSVYFREFNRSVVASSVQYKYKSFFLSSLCPKFFSFFFFLQFFLVNLLGNKIAFKLTWNVIFRSVLKFWYSPTAEWRLIWRKIIAVIYATYAVAKRKPDKNSGLYGIRTLDLDLRSSHIHIFIISSSSFQEFITNQFNDPLLFS